MCIAGENKELLARLRRDIQSITPEEVGMLGSPRVDTQSAVAFIELVHSVKHAIFNIRPLCNQAKERILKKWIKIFLGGFE